MTPTSSPNLRHIGLQILTLYSLKILAITNGPGRAILFDFTSTSSSEPPSTLTIYEFDIPNILDIVRHKTEDQLMQDWESKLSNSLPEPTFEGNSVWERACSPVLTPNGVKQDEILLNPLGAGDTAAGVFMMEYLESKVKTIYTFYFYIFYLFIFLDFPIHLYKMICIL